MRKGQAASHNMKEEGSEVAGGRHREGRLQHIPSLGVIEVLSCVVGLLGR